MLGSRSRPGSTADNARSGTAIGRCRRGRGGAESDAKCGKSNGTCGRYRRLNKGDVHGPVGAWRLPELACAIERVDDPYALRFETGLVVLALFAQHSVIGSSVSYEAHQQLVGATVALVLELGG
jgi:hypothetical protein